MTVKVIQLEGTEIRGSNEVIHYNIVFQALKDSEVLRILKLPRILSKFVFGNENSRNSNSNKKPTLFHKSMNSKILRILEILRILKLPRILP